MKSLRAILRPVQLSIAVSLFSSSLAISQAPTVQPIPGAQVAEQPYQISFFVPIDPNSTNMLIQIVNNQINIGRKKFIILLSSQGGEVLSGLAAYNYLHGIQNLGIDLTTYNLGQVDSAANLIFCAGKHRYALPDTRFLIHSSFNIVPPGTPLNSPNLEGQLQQVKNMNQLSVQVIEATIGKPSKEIEAAINGQNIFDPQQALNLGLIQEIKHDFATPGAAIADVSPLTTAPVNGASNSPVVAGLSSTIPSSKH